jgi:hypothetical protein
MWSSVPEYKPSSFRFVKLFIALVRTGWIVGKIFIDPPFN